jgi:membrane associated rhomboid family serine protease
LLIVCVAVFLPHVAAGGPPNTLVLYGPAVAAGEWWRVLTFGIEHVNSPHILMNGFSIFSFGPFIERRVGSVRLAVVSLVAVLLSACFSLQFNWFLPTAGASGILCGWLGLGLPIVDVRARRVLVQWTILLVLISLIPGISWAGHLGGFIGGLLCGVLMRWPRPSAGTPEFRRFDRVVVLLVLAAAVAVYLVVRAHGSSGDEGLRL